MHVNLDALLAIWPGAVKCEIVHRVYASEDASPVMPAKKRSDIKHKQTQTGKSNFTPF